MAIRATTTTLSTTPSLIASGISLGDPKTVVLKNASATIYIGGADVTTVLGLPLGVGEALTIDLGPGDKLYAVASAGTPTVNTLVNRAD